MLGWRGSGAALHSSVLELLQVQPLHGRLPTRADPDAQTIVLGHDAWQQLGANTTLIGSTIHVEGVPHTVIGVMPPRLGFPERQSFWTVLPPTQSGDIVARLAPGAQRDAVRHALEARLARLNAAAPRGWIRRKYCGANSAAGAHSQIGRT